MIHKLLYILSAVIIFSSCGDIEEEMWLNKDGSGKLVYSVDLSNSLPMLQMMSGQMDSTTTGEGGQELMDGMFEALGGDDIDSTASFYQMMPDSVKETMEGEELLKKMSLNMIGNKEESKAAIRILIDFDSFKEIDKMFKMLTDSYEAGGADGMNMMGQIPAVSFDDNHYLAKKFYKRRPMNTEGGGMGDMMGEDEQADGMMNMMFGSSEYIQTIHFPTKVKSCNWETASVKGTNTVVVRRDLMDVMKQTNVEELEVTFKKKFLGIF